MESPRFDVAAGRMKVIGRTGPDKKETIELGQGIPKGTCCSAPSHALCAHAHTTDSFWRACTEVRTGGLFGEMSLLHGTPATADVIACEPSETYCLPKGAFERLCLAYPHFKRAMGETEAQRKADNDERKAANVPSGRGRRRSVLRLGSAKAQHDWASVARKIFAVAAPSRADISEALPVANDKLSDTPSPAASPAAASVPSAPEAATMTTTSSLPAAAMAELPTTALSELRGEMTKLHDEMEAMSSRLDDKVEGVSRQLEEVLQEMRRPRQQAVPYQEVPPLASTTAVSRTTSTAETTLMAGYGAAIAQLRAAPRTAPCIAPTLGRRCPTAPSMLT